MTDVHDAQILHIQAASIDAAQNLLNAALQAGFRESGVTGLKSACPMVAIRCQGLALDSIIGMSHPMRERQAVSIVSEEYLKILVSLANERFDQNTLRIARFFTLVGELKNSFARRGQALEKESQEARRLRKRAEGLR